MTINPIFTLKEAFKSLWRNRMMSIASITSVTATLAILGIIFALILNINAMAQSAKDQFDEIQVYLLDEVDETQREQLKIEIESINGVEQVVYENKDIALENMKNSWEDNAYLLEGLEKNPLPNSFVIYLTDIYFSKSVLDAIETLDGVEEISSHQDTVEQLLSVTEIVRKAGMAIIFVLIAISTFIINNTIKLAVNSRKREINIMKYVGATNWFIRWPFLLEGTILGIIGALLATLLLKIGYERVFTWITSDFFVLISAYIVKPDVLINDLLFLFLVIGAGIGALGSIWSMRKYLRV